MTPPGATIGILGGGQLGRMLILAGRAMGYRFHVFEPNGPSSAGMVADREFNAAYSDTGALREFADSVDLITLEFENIPSEALTALEASKPVMPGRAALETCQNRQREKDFLKANDLPCVPFEYAASAAELAEAIERIGFPCVLKTADFGYDGKGQIKLEDRGAMPAAALWEQLGAPPRVVVEHWLEHRGEFSVICARKSDGSTHTFPMAENEHRHHILHASFLPARADATVQAEGAAHARKIAELLGVIGLISVEFFLDGDNRLKINEMAPRPHNSGHYTIDACRTSQFEQHIRAIADLPFGATELLCPAVMVNLLGDIWSKGSPDWSRLLDDPRVKLHLYDKGTPRPGRKMGHFTVLDPDAPTAREAGDRLFQQLQG
ncbi:MAG: 5-(carboxyamino)imidazole ribonucleotide synthase [Opitutales bacterium]